MCAQKYLIKPLSGDDEGDHAVIEWNHTNTTCRADFEYPARRQRSRKVVIWALSWLFSDLCYCSCFNLGPEHPSPSPEDSGPGSGDIGPVPGDPGSAPACFRTLTLCVMSSWTWVVQFLQSWVEFIQHVRERSERCMAVSLCNCIQNENKDRETLV